MTRWNKWWAAGAAVAMLLAGCGGGGSSAGNGQVRLINATRSHASIDLLAGTTKVASAVATGVASSYASVGSGSTALQVTDAGQTTSLVSTSPTVAKDLNYTLVAYETGSTVKTAWVTENDATPAAGTTAVRVVGLAPDAGALDVYVTAPSVVLTSGLSPTFTLVASTGIQGTASQSFAPATYRVRVTGAGNQADLRLDMSAVAVADQQVVNLLLLPTAGGALLNGAVLVQKGNYTAQANSTARVRLVSGVTGTRIVASTPTVTLEPGAVSPMIGSYVTVPSGAATWTVTLDGNPVAVPPMTLAAGSDNTLLVTGSAAAASAVALVDDNHLPTTSGTANIRLVSGLPAGASTLSLTVDFVLLASNVVPGSTSAYKPVTANNSMRLEVNTPASVAPISLQTGLNILSGGVFSVFVVGDAASPVTVVRRDR